MADERRNLYLVDGSVGSPMWTEGGLQLGNQQCDAVMGTLLGGSQLGNTLGGSINSNGRTGIYQSEWAANAVLTTGTSLQGSSLSIAGNCVRSSVTLTDLTTIRRGTEMDKRQQHSRGIVPSSPEGKKAGLAMIDMMKALEAGKPKLADRLEAAHPNITGVGATAVDLTKPWELSYYVTYRCDDGDCPSASDIADKVDAVQKVRPLVVHNYQGSPGNGAPLVEGKFYTYRTN